VVGEKIAERYEVEELVGHGGMSSVYKAQDTLLERHVALKILHEQYSADDDFVERFKREARSVAQLQHPNIVTVIDRGEEDGCQYIVFEYIDGESLKQLVDRTGPLPARRVVELGLQIAEALAFAHQHGLVHRDVKPQNVLIDPDGRAKVTDFGIARSLEAQGLTATGRVLGTTDYVSPEQALGHEVTGQSDIYSLGIVLYEMLTGEAPFRADTQVAVAMKHVREPLPDVQRRRPEISASLARVVEHATAKETQNRYQNVSEMVHDLEEVLAIEAARTGQTSGEATTVLKSLSGDTADFAPIRMRRPRRAVALTVIVLAALAVTGVFLATRTEKGPGVPVVKKPRGLTEVHLGGSAASDYDPEGDNSESPEAVGNAIDGIRSTNWDTESYEGGFAGSDKSGVGLYVDAGKLIAARALALVTATPGFTAAVYASETVPPNLKGWTRLTPSKKVKQDFSFRFDTRGHKYRNYLLWISELPSGGDKQKAQIQELSLFK
jgi:serine/threonine-protein kinase